MELTLERKHQPNETLLLDDATGAPVAGIAPVIDKDYWEYRVMVSDTQAVVGFPKFSTIGIGFMVEDDWNTNGPYTKTTEGIWERIAHNKGDDTIPDERCIAAIRMIQEAVCADRGQDPAVEIGRIR